MRKIILLIITFANIVYCANAQDEITSTLWDTMSLKPIEFASVSIKNKDIGTYSNFSGNFTLKKISMFDTIVIRHIGYKTKYIHVNEIEPHKLIYLEPQIIQIGEVVVNPNKYKEEFTWSINSRSKSTFTGFSGFELGTFINGLSENSIIKEVIIKTAGCKEVDEFYIKLHLYDINEGKPGLEIILSKNVFVISSKTKNITLNIESENIRIPSSGIFVSIEWVGKQINEGVDKNITTNLIPKVIVTEKKSPNKTLYRFWNMDWQDFSELLHLQNANIIIGINLIALNR